MTHITKIEPFTIRSSSYKKSSNAKRGLLGFLVIPEAPAFDVPLSVQYIADFLHFAADIGLGHFGVVAGHIHVRMPENLGDDVDRHPVLDGEAGERVPGHMRRQVFVDIADRSQFLEVAVHPLIGRHGQQLAFGLKLGIALVFSEQRDRMWQQRNPAHDRRFLPRLVNPYRPVLIGREVLPPQMVGIGKGQPGQAAEHEYVADAV